MQESSAAKDPFNWAYFLIAVGVLVAIPLSHVIVAWFIYYL
jgi:hypothetical protein